MKRFSPEPTVVNASHELINYTKVPFHCREN